MNATQAQTAFAQFVEALTARQAAVPSRDNEITLSYMTKNEKAIKAGMVKFPAEVIKGLVDAQKVEAKATDNFIAVKVNVKIVHALAAFGLNSLSALDKYSHSIIKNIIALQGLDNLNAQRSICSKIEIDELDIAKSVKIYHNCSPSTASTQTSSTREMLRHLDLCQAVKRAKADVIAMRDNKQANMLLTMFA